MINIYSQEFIKRYNLDLIWDVEPRFKAVYKNLLKMKETSLIVKYIDEAEFIDKETLKGKFGIFSFKDISTGCKALLLSNYYKDSKIVNFIECGDNVFQCANDLNIDCYIYVNRLFILNDTNTIVMYDKQPFKNSKLDIK